MAIHLVIFCLGLRVLNRSFVVVRRLMLSSRQAGVHACRTNTMMSLFPGRDLVRHSGTENQNWISEGAIRHQCMPARNSYLDGPLWRKPMDCCGFMWIGNTVTVTGIQVGDTIRVTPDKVEGSRERVSIQYESILDDLGAGTALVVMHISQEWLHAFISLFWLFPKPSTSHLSVE
jgi:hypothetical protein